MHVANFDVQNIQSQQFGRDLRLRLDEDARQAKFIKLKAIYRYVNGIVILVCL